MCIQITSFKVVLSVERCTIFGRSFNKDKTGFITVEWDMFLDNDHESYDIMIGSRDDDGSEDVWIIRQKISAGKYLGRTFTDKFHNVKIVS